MGVGRAAAGPVIEPLLAERWSPRAFDAGRAVERGALERMLEAARWAPSCFNSQPWRFVIAERSTDPHAWRTVLESLVDSNRAWASAAPVLVVICADGRFADGKPNRWAGYDAGAAAMSFALQGAAIGLAVHQMGGFDAVAVTRALHTPADWQALSIAAVGYPGDTGLLSERQRGRELAPRTRQGAAEFAHWGVRSSASTPV